MKFEKQILKLGIPDDIKDCILNKFSFYCHEKFKKDLEIFK